MPRESHPALLWNPGGTAERGVGAWCVRQAEHDGGGNEEGHPVGWPSFPYRDSGIRTHDLLNPIQVRYQLRYVPLEEEKLTRIPGKTRGERANKDGHMPPRRRSSK